MLKKKKIKKLEFISMNPNSTGLSKYEKIYKNYHSRWIHTSWLLLSDLGKNITLDDVNYTIVGMWDNEDAEVTILLKPTVKGMFRLVNSKKVANALGYTKMRNLATGEVRNVGVEDVVIMSNSNVFESNEDEDYEEDIKSPWDDTEMDEIEENEFIEDEDDEIEDDFYSDDF